MSGVGFEWTIRFGDVLTMGGAVLVGLGIFYRRAGAEAGLSIKVDEMKEELKELSKVITEQAVQNQRLVEQSRRMTMLEQRVEDLRRGRGYVTERDQKRPIVDGEY